MNLDAHARVLGAIVFMTLAACSGSPDQAGVQSDTDRGRADSALPPRSDSAPIAPSSAEPAAPSVRPAPTVATEQRETRKKIERLRDSSLPTAATAPAPPRRVVVNGVDLTGIGYDRGSATAPVVVVNFSDFGCPYCGEFERQTFPAIYQEYVQTGKVFFKYVPFVIGMFPNGQQAARAAECAADQGQFWPMHDRLYATQSEWKRSVSPYALFQQFAATLNLDRDRFSKCYVAQQTDPRTRRATDAADQLGVRVTPSFVVNGKPVQGALPIADFRLVLNAALK